MRFILELIGTVAFAISGAVTGVQKKMDIFGISILAMTTAVGGGIIRDIILNVTPPAALRNPVFTLCAIAIGIIVFYLVKHHFQPQHHRAYDMMLGTMDAIGLGVFTVIGVQSAYAHVPEANAYLAVFVGVITGVGGGILRDIFAGNSPFVFSKHFYACASLIGAIVCAVSWSQLDTDLAMILGAVIVIVLRNLASHYRWSLPRIE